MLAAFVAGCLTSGVVAATAADAPPANKAPEPRNVELVTGDQLRLALTYYPSEKGKEAVPVVMLHMWKQSRGDYKDLALYLQNLGYAVVVPDLRGHGQSTHFRNGRRDENLKAATLPLFQYRAMVLEDMKAVKNFLWEENNAGHLNLNKLCVLGAEMGAAVALNFAGYDALGYDSNLVQYGPLQLGQFVKALVLISPEWSFRGLPVKEVMTVPYVRHDIAMLLIVGEQDHKAYKQATRIYDVLERFHPEPTGDDKIDRKTLFLIGLDTSLQGTKLLDPKLKVPALVADFLSRRLLKSDEATAWAWKEYRYPHQ